MPAGDRTGPWGSGPRTGRGAGYCAGCGVPGFMNAGPGMGSGRGVGRGYGRGMGLGLGMGRGRRFRHPGAWGFVPVGYGTEAVPPAEEAAALADEAQFLESELRRVRERQAELKKTGPTKKEQK